MFDHEVQNTWASAGLQAMHAACNADDAAKAWRKAAYEQTRPCVIFRPKVYPDGNMWCALYGDNLMEGVAGFGETPEKACVDFDIAWLNQRAMIAAPKGGES